MPLSRNFWLRGFCVLKRLSEKPDRLFRASEF